MAAQNKRALGRGLEALFGDDDLNLELGFSDKSSPTKSGIKMLSINDLQAGKYQPRQNFNQEAIKALAESVKEKGILQPILVRKSGSKYEIIAGERRFRAAKIAGLAEVPVIEKEMSDNEVLEVALIENIVRQDLTAIEEASGLGRLIKQFSYTQEKLSQVIGKSRSYIANSLRLLVLPAEIKNMINNHQLSAGHARTLIGIENAVELAKKIIAEGLSVRQAEELIASIKSRENKVIVKSEKKQRDVELMSIEKGLSEKFGVKVKINTGKNGKGKIILSYNDLSQLENIINQLEQ